MSSGDPETRQRILGAAKDLLEESPGAPVPMTDVAARAGVSRQALYLHFADRTSLFLEVSRMVDGSLRTPARQRRVDEAPTGREALREAVALQAWLKPRLKGVATALDVLRRSDPAADAAWQEREHARLERCERVVRRLHAEGELAYGWDVPSAARCFWAVTSQRVWDDLAIDQGWSMAKYRAHLTTLLEAGLLRETPPGSHATRPER
ncbi:MAG TPA: TetR/AcrR family transcriptional regulator [Acidimicrobiales bacterium]|nr:TetR/AcrR family transcriptional regulator [Acidimicrobiales bacterium]